MNFLMNIRHQIMTQSNTLMDGPAWDESKSLQANDFIKQRWNPIT